MSFTQNILLCFTQVLYFTINRNPIQSTSIFILFSLRWAYHRACHAIYWDVLIATACAVLLRSFLFSISFLFLSLVLYLLARWSLPSFFSSFSPLFLSLLSLSSLAFSLSLRSPVELFSSSLLCSQLIFIDQALSLTMADGYQTQVPDIVTARKILTILYQKIVLAVSLLSTGSCFND